MAKHLNTILAAWEGWYWSFYNIDSSRCLRRRSSCRQLSGVGAGQAAEVRVVGVLVAEVCSDDEVAPGEEGLVRALLHALDLLHLDVDLVRDALVLIRRPEQLLMNQWIGFIRLEIISRVLLKNIVLMLC